MQTRHKAQRRENERLLANTAPLAKFLKGLFFSLLLALFFNVKV